MILFSILIAAAIGAADSQADLIRDALAYHQNPSKSLREAFNDKYLTINEGSSPLNVYHIFYPDSTYYLENDVTANTLALAFGLVPEKYKDPVGRNLIAELANNRRWHLDIAPEAEPYLLPVLSSLGRGDLAYFMNDPEADVKWDHHVAPEYVEQWRVECLAGLTTRKGWWRTKARVKPDFSIDELDSLDTSLPAGKGELRSKWVKDLMHLEWDVTVPKGARAEVYVPSVHRDHIEKNGPARRVRKEDGCTVYKLRPGVTHFSVDFDLPQYVVEREFVYEHASFPQCHAATICEAENGDLLAGFYGGTAEGHPDVEIRLSRKAKGQKGWTPPVSVADEPREVYTTENPVLFRVPEPGEPLLLFYKVGPGFHPKEGDIDLCRQAFWEGCVKRSYDNGHTWSEADSLPKGCLGPIKNKPVWHDGRIIAPSSIQHKYNHIGWHIQFELSDDKGKTWRVVTPDSVDLSIPSPLRKRGRQGENKDVPKRPDAYYPNWRPIQSIQPTILIHKDGSLQALSRTNNGTASTVWSHDNGSTWEHEYLTDIPQNRSGMDACTLPDGRFALVYTDFEPMPGGGGAPRTPLKLAISEDGLHFTNIVTLEDSVVRGYAYPAIIYGSDGCLHILYNWRRFRMKYVKVKV